MASGIVAESFDASDPCNRFNWGDVANSTAMGAVFGAGLGPLSKLNASSAGTGYGQVVEGLGSANVTIYSGIGAKR